MNADIFRVHSFRVDRINHLVVTTAGHVRRNGRHLAICALRIDDTAQRVTPQAVTSCDACIDGLTGFVNVLDTDFDYPTWDDGTGRFA